MHRIALLFLLLISLSCQRLPSEMRGRNLFVSSEIGCSIIDTSSSNFKELNSYSSVAKFPLLIKEKFKGMGFKISDSAGSAFSIRLEPVFILVDRIPVSISDSVKKELVTGHFMIYSAQFTVTYRFYRGDSLWYSKTFSEELPERYETRTVKQNALAYAILTDRSKWDVDGRVQLRHLGFEPKAINLVVEQLVKAMAADFRKTAKKLPLPEITDSAN